MITIGTNAYITEAQYAAYAAERGIVVTLASLEADIVKSADFIDLYYNFKGDPVDAAQEMKLPTDQVTIANIAKAALKAVELQQAGRLTLDTATMTGAMIASESATLDGTGSESITYVEGSQVTYKPRTPELDLLLRSFISGGSGLKRG